jgi:hypothetical protein
MDKNTIYFGLIHEVRHLTVSLLFYLLFISLLCFCRIELNADDVDINFIRF